MGSAVMLRWFCERVDVTPLDCRRQGGPALIDRRPIISYTDRCEQLTQLIMNDLKQGRTRDTVGALGANYADAPQSSAKTVVV